MMNEGVVRHFEPTVRRNTNIMPCNPLVDYIEMVEIPRLERQQKFAKQMIMTLGGIAGVTVSVLGVWLTL